jgi:hypothetical protein
VTWSAGAGAPRRLAVAVAVAALGLAGLGLVACGQLPVSEQIRTVRPFDPQTGTDDPVEVGKFPHGPVAGQSPDRVVEGFIGAADADDPHHNAARAFLAPEVRWDDSALTVYDATSLDSKVRATCVPGRDCTVQVSVRTIGRVKPDGRYQPVSVDDHFDYVLQYRSGQWVITGPAPTALITRGGLARGYHSVVLYFLSKVTGALVPQPILLPNSVAGRPTSVTAALLAGPPAGLTGVLTTAIPTGSRVLGSVTRVDDQVTADVRMPFRAGEPVARLAAWTQLRRTLAELPGVQDVILQQDGLPPVEPAGAGPEDPDAGPRTGALVIRNGHIEAAGLVRRPAPDQSVARPIPAPVAQLAVSSAGEAAVLTWDGRLQLWAENRWQPSTDRYSSAAWLGRSGLLALSTDGRTVVRVGTDGGTSAVRLEPVGQPLAQLAVSPDGSRIAVVAGRAGARSVYLGRIGRSATGQITVGSTDWIRVALPGGDVRAVDWSSPLDIVALVSPTPGVTGWTVSLLPGSVLESISSAGLPESPKDVAADSIAAGNGAPLLVTVRGQVYRAGSTGRWVKYGQGTNPAYPG